MARTFSPYDPCTSFCTWGPLQWSTFSGMPFLRQTLCPSPDGIVHTHAECTNCSADPFFASHPMAESYSLQCCRTGRCQLLGQVADFSFVFIVIQELWFLWWVESLTDSVNFMELRVRYTVIEAFGKCLQDVEFFSHFQFVGAIANAANAERWQYVGNFFGNIFGRSVWLLWSQVTVERQCKVEKFVFLTVLWRNWNQKNGWRYK